jgi:phage terminase large subunit
MTELGASFLFTPSRYKILHGGRGSAKSQDIARALIVKATQTKLRWLCAREVQRSIKDSVHRLLTDLMEQFGLSGTFFQPLETSIRAVNGSEFLFTGLMQHTVESIKSFEGVDGVWVEEGQSVSKRSSDVLIPTIRKPGSEIWVSMNPDLVTDDAYRRYVLNPPPGAIVREYNWRTNPWFTAELEAERLHCQKTAPDDYDNIWEGKCRAAYRGAIYANELASARKENRITKVPHDPSRPVETAWDIGYGDSTPIWFFQRIMGGWVHIIDFYMANGVGLDHYTRQLRADHRATYQYDDAILPHDAGSGNAQTGKSFAQMLKSLGVKNRVLPRDDIESGIAAVRLLFPRLLFDAERCADGLQYLSRYRWKETRDGKVLDVPNHDDSDPADALRYMALGIKPLTPKQKESGGFSGVSDMGMFG